MKTIHILKSSITTLIAIVACAASAFSQTYTAPLPQPIKELKVSRGRNDTVINAAHVLVGVAPKGSKVWVNKNEVKVFKTGSFGYESTLLPGPNMFIIDSELNGKKEQLAFSIFYNDKPKSFPPVGLAPESVRLSPDGKDIWIMEGDPLQIRVVAKEGAQLSWFNGYPLYELKEASDQSRAQIGPGRSIYQGIKRINSASISGEALKLTITEGNDIREYPIERMIRVLSPDRPVTVRTRNGAYLNESWGTDRLGASKINFLDSDICLQVIGKTDALYKVRLGSNHSAYIPENLVELLPEGYYPPTSLTVNWTVETSGKFDVLTIPLPARHPYTIYQEAVPNRLVVDLYSVANNSNWITQRFNVKEVKSIDMRQIAPDVLRYVIDLKDKASWGYIVEYSGNNLVIKVKHRPDLSKIEKGDWSDLTFALDAGHGGDVPGAISPSGYVEQHQNLAMSYMLKEMLEKHGAKVVMTRPENKFVEMADRKKFVNDNQPDLLISIHCNAGGNPLHGGGTSTYYKHIGFRPLSMTILARLLELPIREYGNVGNFNFSLNAPTMCPNVLVEVLYMSALHDEELIADPAFQRTMMEKVILGVEDFLRGNF